ncbi:HTH-type transcriptional regulator CdhR [compost metagenome]
MAEAEEALIHESALPAGESGIQRIVKQMIHYMSSQYAHPVSIEQMCSSLGYNRAYLSRIFKKETGTTPVTYLLKLRIDKSRQLLRERPELSIEQIASSVGLTDALYFSRQFRRFHGESPSQYRKNAAGKKTSQ